MKPIFTHLAAFMLGGLTTVVLIVSFKGDPAPKNDERAGQARAVGAHDSGRDRRGPPSGPPEPGPERRPPENRPAGEGPPPGEPIQARLERLEKENSELRGRLGMADDERRLDQGTPVKPPENLDQRFSKDALMDSIDKALKETGFKADVTDVDCTEHPCIIVGTAEGEMNADMAKKLMEAAALSIYKDDWRSIVISSTMADDGQGGKKPVGTFYISFYPKPAEPDPEGDANLAKRWHYRKQQLMDAVHDH